MPELHIDQDGIDRIVLAYKGLGGNSIDMRSVGDAIRDRWRESESRTFAAATWQPRATTTTLRYRHPVRHTADEQLHRASGGTMHFTGLTERTLTTRGRGARGIVNRVDLRPGDVDVTVGIAGGPTPLFYAALNDQGTGRLPRRPVVVFDELALTDAAGDALEHLLDALPE